MSKALEAAAGPLRALMPDPWPEVKARAVVSLYLDAIEVCDRVCDHPHCLVVYELIEGLDGEGQ